MPQKLTKFTAASSVAQIGGDSFIPLHRERPRAQETTMARVAQQLGGRIREQRKQLHCTQEELAHRAHISVSFLSMVERGERVPRLETLTTLADALGIAVSDLFTGVNEHRTEGGEMLRPLIAFLEGQSLDSSDLERLLTIAKALFKAKKG